MMSKVGLTVHALLGPILHTGVVSFKRNINQQFSTHENTRWKIKYSFIFFYCQTEMVIFFLSFHTISVYLLSPCAY